MSTIGHPLSDLVNLTMPFLIASGGPNAHQGFVKGATPGLPTKEEAVAWYAEVAGWDPRPEFKWGEAFGMFRNACIMQGIAARYALRQASSTKAKDYAAQMEPFSNFCYSLIEDAAADAKAKSNL